MGCHVNVPNAHCGAERGSLVYTYQRPVWGQATGIVHCIRGYSGLAWDGIDIKDELWYTGRDNRAHAHVYGRSANGRSDLCRKGSQMTTPTVAVTGAGTHRSGYTSMGRWRICHITPGCSAIRSAGIASMDEKKFEDITPTPEEYAMILRVIIKSSVKPLDRLWAADELVRIQPALEKGDWIRK